MEPIRVYIGRSKGGQLGDTLVPGHVVVIVITGVFKQWIPAGAGTIKEALVNKGWSIDFVTLRNFGAQEGKGSYAVTVEIHATIADEYTEADVQNAIRRDLGYYLDITEIGYAKAYARQIRFTGGGVTATTTTNSGVIASHKTTTTTGKTTNNSGANSDSSVLAALKQIFGGTTNATNATNSTNSQPKNDKSFSDQIADFFKDSFGLTGITMGTVAIVLAGIVIFKK